MEQNDFPTSDASTQGQGGTAGFGATGGAGNTAGSSASTGSTTGGFGGTADMQTGMKDRARDLAGSAQEKLADVGSSMRERAGTLKDSLADALESSADKLRARSTGGQGALAGETGSTSVALEGDSRVADVSNRVAGGMEATADWLREADLDGLKTGIERQVKEHPGRTLLIAAGLGYLLGKALKK